MVFAGLSDLLQSLEALKFDDSDLEFLKEAGFDKTFLSYLESFRFSGEVEAMREGEIVFPGEPVLLVRGNIIEAQLIESLLLNILNFQSLIATKAARMRQSAGDCTLIDFGLRRAQGLGSIHASRAAVIGGFDSTSHTFGAKLYDIKSTGTQAHSWIESFQDELEAFRAYAKAFPNNCFFLVDTYNTLRSGVPNAITVAKEMEENGQKLRGIRLDSGDLSYLSKKSRKMLDTAGLGYVQIAVSNQLDEHIIKSLREQDSPIDVFGVGTSLVTGKTDAALDGVYKLSSFDGVPRLKISDNKEKTILPGQKSVYRFTDGDNCFVADGIFTQGEKENRIHHPADQQKHMETSSLTGEALLKVQMENGKRSHPVESLENIYSFSKSRLHQLPPEHKRFENPHEYKIGVGEKLLQLRSTMIENIRNKFTSQ